MAPSTNRRLPLCVGIVFVLVLFLGPAGSVHAEDWYRYRGPNFSGISSETEWTHDWPAGGPTSAWKANVGVGLSSVSISNERLLTIGNVDDVDTIYCLSAETGREIWNHSYSSPTDPNEFDGGPTSTPTIDGDVVYALSRSGDLFACSLSSGDVHW